MKTFITIFIAGMMMVILLTVPGCEAESASDSTVTITPESATLAKGESVELTASGGYEYTWTLDTGGEAWGSLSTRTGDRTVYTSIADSASNSAATIRIIYVSSSIPGAGSSSNDTGQSYSELNTAEAYITHLPGPETIEADQLVLSPDSVEIHAGEIKEFTASGGDGSYSWSITPSSYGALSSPSGNKVAYVSSNVNVTASVAITVISGSQSAVSIINHKP